MAVTVTENEVIEIGSIPLLLKLMSLLLTLIGGEVGPAHKK